MENIHIGESGELISDVTEIVKTKKLDSLVVMDIEKAFDSLDHDFLFLALEKYGFGEHFTKRSGVLCY